VSQLRGLVVDYGGVLTESLDETMAAWMGAEGIDAEEFIALMERWLGPDAPVNPVHELEAGRLPVPDFELLLAAQLRRRDGGQVPAAGLVTRMLGGFRMAESMVGVVATARALGLRTALLSNSWGLDYPREGWEALFDAVVISGEVGMRKPEGRIYRHTAELLGLSPGQCVFVDDLAHNVRGAVSEGMVGLHHTDLETTVRELEVLFDRRLR
jgi:epoxide hydrolase-like predicted phosphatase